MAISITHPFVSLKGDGGDATLVKPSHWNAAHATSMATGNLLGRLTVGAGAFEEIPISAYMAALLASADKDALADALGLFETGDVKWSYNTAASSGWVVCSLATGTIGNAASGATLRANADVQNLYVMVYTNVDNTYAPVSGGRTGNAVNDFNAGKTLGLLLTGRAPVGAGNGTTGITTRGLGQTFGTETHQLSIAELPVVTPAGTVTTTTTITNGTVVMRKTGSGIESGVDGTANSQGTITASSSSTFTGTPFGSGVAHSNTQPSIALYAHVKL